MYSQSNLDNTLGAVYVVRDPRNVATSFAHHYQISIDEATDQLCNKDLFTKKTDFHPQTLISSWGLNYLSWLALRKKVLILKYEDLVYDKLNSVNKIVDFFKKNYSFKFDNLEIKLNNIIKSTEFKILKKYEEKNGFSEATEHNRFFSVGKKNQWKEVLNENQIKKIEEKSKEVMRKFNYK